ncbi:unnamed protein product [Candida verbasci]|uniref:Peroxisomal membrane protein PEX13 n=1 Tax=Candida verbasci TaxID=1227364 RepID=A0A9W4TTA2_9ASCO|nr:unnamed protein product [Candida verbasci]
MSSSAPRTKPWEVSSGTSAASATNNTNPITATTNNTTTANNNQPSIPDKPSSLTSEFNTMADSQPYGSSSYNTTGYGSRYGSGYGSGMYGSGMYGSGYGSGMYGSSMYGGYGSGMYGGGMYGGSGMYGNNMMMGQGGMAGGLGEGTQATFQLIESIIGAVGGFAQMLEATYMATHSSFFTMINLAEQFGNLKNALGSLLGIFALIKLIKKFFYKITGQNYNNGLNLSEFSKFEKQQKKLEDNLSKQKSSKRISFKPLLLFLAASIGFPYLLSKAIQLINEQNQRKIQQQQQQQQGQGQFPPGSLDPSNLQFAKTLYEFNPENPQIEIELKPNELVAILSRLDPLGNESKWWKVRSRSGKVGYVPSNYLSVIERRKDAKMIQQNPPQQEPEQQPSLEKENFLKDFKQFNN